MLVLQISDLHLGPEDHDSSYHRVANQVAWGNARSLAETLRRRADADDLVIVISGDLTDEGHTFPQEIDAVHAWVRKLPGKVLVLPGNHDVGNFTSSDSLPKIDAPAVERWIERFGDDRFSLARDGHRLLGVNSMLWGSGLPREKEQDDWMLAELDAADAAGESVWVFQHAPLFLREPGEERTRREVYWCPPAKARDRVLSLLNRPCVKAVSNGHVHRRFDLKLDGRLYRDCPALSGTHTDADYFLRNEAVHQHDLAGFDLRPGSAQTLWIPTGIETKVRYPA